MLGLALGAFSFLCKKIGDFKNDYESLKNRKISIREGRDTYLDYYGAERLVSNNKYVFRHNMGYDIHKDYVLEDSYGNIIRNYSQSQRDKIRKVNVELAQKNGNTVYLKPLSNNELNNIHSMRCIYIDFETGRELFVHGHNQYSFFRDAQTGEYVRLADSDRYRKGTDLDAANKIMQIQNEKWKNKSNKEKQWWLKQEMEKMNGSDTTVPDSRYYNKFGYKMGKIKLSPQEYEAIVNRN